MTSSIQYVCTLCKKSFAQKIDYTRHQNKKSPCISLLEIEELAQKKVIKTDTKNALINVFKAGCDILRVEGLTGEKALRNMSYFLILKLIEPHFGHNIDIDNYTFDFGHIQDDMVETHKNKLLSIVRFSNLVNEPEDNIPSNMKYLWDDILSVHPSTNNIFLAGKGFDIQYKSTYKKLIDKLNTLPDVENDMLGAAYEEVIQGVMTGKVLGQFFTQPLIKNIMVKLLDPQIHPDGTIETCGDPTMGTGGFLITYLKYILDQAKTKDITPNWEFIKTEGLYGKELEPDTYQLAVSNMLISSGQMFETFDRGDSIREPITRKFDNILANPPFGIKGLDYDDFPSPLKSEYVPIKTDNAVSLFIQAIIYMLKLGGKCAVVLPDGQDLFSKSTAYVAIREFLLKTCDLKEVIYLPSGVFAYASIKTCIFYFIKKKEGTDVLDTTIKISKTQRETGRSYKFSKTHQTTNVRFYETQIIKTNGQDELKKQLLIEVPIEILVSHSYSLNYGEYLKADVEEPLYEEGTVVKTLGEVCNIEYGTRIVKSSNVEGPIPVYGSGRAMFSTQTFNREGFNILIGRFALSLECVRFVNKSIYLNDSGLSVTPKDAMLLHKYIGYYLYMHQNLIYECARGTAQKNLDIKEFKLIKIPIPPLERQQEIVECLDFVELSNQTSKTKIMELKKLNECCLTYQARFGENVVKTLGEVCNIDQGNSLTKINMTNGIYDVIGGGKIIGKHNETNRDGDEFTLTRVGDININYIIDPYYLTDNGFSVKSIIKEIITKYLYYLILHNKHYLISLYKGTAQKVISKTNLKSIKIPIPPLDKQQEIVEYCEANDALIKQLDEQMLRNKSQFSPFNNGGLGNSEAVK